MNRHDHPAGSGRRGVNGAVLASILLLAGGSVLLGLGLDLGSGRAGPPPQPPAAMAVAAAPAPATAGSGEPVHHRRPAGARPGESIGRFLPASRPTRLEIGSIGLRSDTFVALHVQRDGTLSVPPNADTVGFYQAGPTPGQPGSAVLAAHVDTASGAEGVFYRLGAVRRGETIRVTRADGTVPVFTIDRVQAFSKSAFPTADVYHSDLTSAQIRLITCGGPLGPDGSYRNNIVVFAHLAST
ncbi:MAG: sortase [Intrasporangium sp.]|uniref:class F sortase n=1 Tax=Intrasporangium sp. TaxID=1925024 RepID=UPI002649F273|nr:class F sortase [Intrasporangium sp.]MDN5798190.1 sortase [Intrasporangium sp.]